VNPTSSLSTNSTITAHTEQPTAVQKVEQNTPTIGFFAIGMVINIVMISAYFIWAYKQWKKTDKQDKN
jgi:hypothetical protein